MKKYALVVDYSPTEQLSDDQSAIVTMGMVFGLRDPKSFDRVGKEIDASDKPLSLKKWGGASKSYRKKFIDHLAEVVSQNDVICGMNYANQAAIFEVGKTAFEQLYGPFPAASSQNKKGKDRIKLGGYKVDGKIVPPFEVLKDDLCVLGWMTESFASCLAFLDDINDEPVKLDVLIDRLPNEQGEDEFYKATLLKHMLSKATGSRATIVGVADPQITTQREIFVDNVAGLASEMYRNPNSSVSSYAKPCPTKLFAIDRTILR